jgi:SAM-dependent methyltransferase
MLEVAREKAKAQGLTNVEFRPVDGEVLDVESGSFDAVTCRWGLMFMPEAERCLGQAHAALNSGGRMAVAVWGPPLRNPFLALPMGIARKYFQGPLPDPSAPGGVFSFADKDRLRSVFAAAGFRDIRVDDLELPMAVFDSGQEFWQYMQEIAGPLAALVARLAPANREAVAQEIIAAAPQGRPEGKVSLNGYTLLASGVK